MMPSFKLVITVLLPILSYFRLHTEGTLTIEKQQPRIIGGENANETEFPFMVSLQMKPPFGEQYHFCGGSLYFSNMIATSASCVYNRIPSQIEVVAGAHNLSHANPEIQRRDVREFLIDPEFDPDKLQNDIALLVLNQPFDLSSHIDLIEFPNLNHPEIYVGNCTVLGWGSGSDPNSPPQVLQKLNMTLVPNPTCASIYESIQEITDSMICARGTIPEKTQGPCTGDNGGPIICNQPQPSQWYPDKIVPVVAGVMTWSMLPCGNSAYPSIYTNISHMYNSDWTKKF